MIMSETNSDMKTKKKRFFRRKKKKNKLTIVFDENARREFLTGFHKRKLERKRRAKEELEKQLKAERKRIKAEAKEMYKKLLLAQKPIPELDDLISENIDMGTHSVSVTELSTSDLARKNNWIGVNEVKYEEKEDNESDKSENEPNIEQNLMGMELRENNKKKSNKDTFTLKNSKDLKKKIKQHATANVKKSKIFKKKATFEKIKSMKLKRRQEKMLKKLNKKNKRNKHRDNKLNTD